MVFYDFFLSIFKSDCFVTFFYIIQIFVWNEKIFLLKKYGIFHIPRKPKKSGSSVKIDATVRSIFKKNAQKMNILKIFGIFHTALLIQYNLPLLNSSPFLWSIFIDFRFFVYPLYKYIPLFPCNITSEKRYCKKTQSIRFFRLLLFLKYLHRLINHKKT